MPRAKHSIVQCANPIEDPILGAPLFLKEAAPTRLANKRFALSYDGEFKTQDLVNKVTTLVQISMDVAEVAISITRDRKVSTHIIFTLTRPLVTQKSSIFDLLQKDTYLRPVVRPLTTNTLWFNWCNRIEALQLRPELYSEDKVASIESVSPLAKDWQNEIVELLSTEGQPKGAYLYLRVPEYERNELFTYLSSDSRCLVINFPSERFDLAYHLIKAVESRTWDRELIIFQVSDDRQMIQVCNYVNIIKNGNLSSARYGSHFLKLGTRASTPGVRHYPHIVILGESLTSSSFRLLDDSWALRRHHTASNRVDPINLAAAAVDEAYQKQEAYKYLAGFFQREFARPCSDGLWSSVDLDEEAGRQLYARMKAKLSNHSTPGLPPQVTRAAPFRLRSRPSLSVNSSASQAIETLPNEAFEAI